MPQNFKRRTKIVCTIGPATRSPAKIEQLMRAGMDVARLNLSHGELGEHAAWVESIRGVAAHLNKNIAVLLDLPGPKFRIGKLANGLVRLRRGEEVTVTTRPVSGGEGLLPVNLPELARDIKPGNTVLLADGAMILKVESVQGTEIRCKVMAGGVLESGKGLDVPGIQISAPFLTEALKSAVDFAVKQQPDIIALSFVGKASDVEDVRARLKQQGADIPVVSKIERAQAVPAFDSILKVSDGIMVARGDMGVELPLEKVPLVQKDIIKKCNEAGKPVITATEMLESMINSPRPTRAETTDVANAIFDGTDATMLSGETSVGKYPLQAVRMMARIAIEAERKLPYDRMIAERECWLEHETDELISFNACLTADSLGAAAIVAFTQSGSTARRVSKYRPQTPILALTMNDRICRRLALRWGVHAVKVPEQKSVDGLFETGCRVAKELKIARKGDLIVITGGVPIGIAGTTNLLKVERVE